MDLRTLLQQVADGILTPDAALASARATLEHDMTFARLDLGRSHRQGLPEVIYCPGKQPEQIVHLLRALRDAGQDGFATRASLEDCATVRAAIPEAVIHEVARAITLDVQEPRPPAVGAVAVISAGTADLPVAEEAALTAERLHARVDRVFDVGVSGLHRLTRHLDTIRAANAIIVVAGMEGALPSVVGGLVDRPLIAVPTSTGYGANFQGLAPLLSMLNSCAPGVVVVNIDNGFGAGVCAARINRRSVT